jgi:hypothetical protein
MEKRKKIKKKTQKEKEEIKEQKEIKEISYDEKLLEERIKKLNQEINRGIISQNSSANIGEENVEILDLPTPLKKRSIQQRTPRRLERSIMSSNPPTNKEEEEDSIKYSLTTGGKKKEEKYNVISQEYSTMQKESRKQNTDFLVQSDFNEFSKRNILEDSPKRNINPIAEESLRSAGKKDEEYFIKPAFTEKERKPHNPFEKKEIKYDKFEQ